MKLHVGCGTRHLLGYVNIDTRAEVHPDLVMEAMEVHKNYSDLDEIYACHVLEHFREPDHVLKHWRKALKQHGILRLAVPDMDAILGAYNAGVSLPRLSGLIWGRQDYPENTHYHGWDYETLANLLRETGYYDVERWWPWDVFPEDYHDISYGRICTYETEQYQISLNVQAKKI